MAFLPRVVKGSHTRGDFRSATWEARFWVDPTHTATGVARQHTHSPAILPIPPLYPRGLPSHWPMTQEAMALARLPLLKISLVVMEVEEVACLWMLYRRCQRRKKKVRKYWIHPILHDRMTHGMFWTLYPKLRLHEGKFFNYMRMSMNTFDELLAELEPDITSTTTMMRDSVSPEEKLVITLRWVFLLVIKAYNCK